MRQKQNYRPLRFDVNMKRIIIGVSESEQFRLNRTRSLFTKIMQYNSQDGDTVRPVSHIKSDGVDGQYKLWQQPQHDN